MPTELTVNGMACDGCEATVEEALEDLAGVTGAAADHERDMVSVEGDADSDDLVTAIEAAGYEPSV